MTSVPIMPDDEQFLEEHYPGRWRVLGDGEGILVCGYPLPDGYDKDATDLMVRIPADYPGAQLDMFYLCPPIKRKDNKDMHALADEHHFDMHWQRWSRHYQWQPGVHCLATHFAYIENALKHELSL